MKGPNTQKVCKEQAPHSPHPKGFALVVTVSMMILLALLAIGLLSLSTISMRGSSQAGLMMQARANARMAMMVAIGEAQKSLGPDRSAAAPASALLDNPAHPHAAGVWQSWTWDPTDSDSAPDYTSEKENLFLGWLMSDDREPGNRFNPDFPSQAPQSSVLLVGSGSATSLNADDKPEMRAGVLSIETEGYAQGFAWAALQEDIKAHVQPGAGNVEPQESENQFTSIFAPDESGLELLDFTGNLKDDREARQFSISTSTISLAGGSPDVSRQSFHHLSPHTFGVIADAAQGGLRRDLTTEFENFSSSSLRDQRLFDADTDAEPWWNHLADYYSLDQRVNAEGAGGTQPIDLDRDLRYFSELGSTNHAPKRAVLSPVVAKVDIVFSMVTHDLRSNYQAKYRRADPNNTHYSPWLVFEPVVTMWNPYNVPVKFSELKLFFDKIPVGFRFQKKEGRGRWSDVRNQSGDTTEYWWPLSRFIWGGGKTDAITEFYVRLMGGTSDTRPGGDIILSPGETRVFTAHVLSRETWGQVKNDFIITNSNDAKSKIQAGGSGVNYTGGWNRTGGFRFDHLARWQDLRNPASVYSFEKNTLKNRNDWHWIALRGSDGFRAKARLLDNDNPDNDASADNDRDRSFSMKVALMAQGANMGEARKVVQNMDIEVEDFHKLYREGEPKIIEHDIIAEEAYQSEGDRGPGGKSPFAVLSLTAKPTRDLLHPTKGWLFSNPATSNVTVDEKEGPYSIQSYEMSFLEVFGSNSFPMVDVDIATGTRGFFGPGQTSQFGLTSAPMFTLPKEPMVSIAQFQTANILASDALPHFNYPVGNSHAHPLISSSRVKENEMFDYSYGMNWKLWDSFYFSSLSDRAEVNATKFINGEIPLNSRMVSTRPAGMTDDDVLERITGGQPGERGLRIASHQLIKGAFNVNSTSIEAWQAILSGLRSRSLPDREGNRRESAEDTPFGRLIPTSTPEDEALAIGGGAGTGGQESARAARWVGIHLLDDEQIETLATKIVEEIKKRAQEDKAPILTLGEFVNRRPGSATDIHSVRGLLQTAIDEANDEAKIFDLEEDGDPILTTETMANMDALDGNTAEGSPADLLQGDILHGIGSFLTTHTDTLRIRGYGTAGEGNAKVETWCEAIIQRLPEYVDPSDAAEDLPTPGSVNERFGRRFQIVSFRWLAREEI
ncbi:hypothetical protein [Haloferula sp.]|uniref:hypothetical protein n=1 Tax=Haloferula sp. TaxID=2497595 RepID=UPI00329B1566